MLDNMYRDILLKALTLLILKSTLKGPQLILGVWNQTCLSDCACCVDQICEPRLGFSNACTNGCIDGHRGLRCYEICENNCKTCFQGTNICGDCYESFYLENTNCNRCPTNCKTCSSSTRCESCKEGFENRGDLTACEYHVCPENCICEDDICVACKNSYYDTEYSCQRKCPDHCLSCLSSKDCSECQDGYFNGYKSINGNNFLISDCSLKCRDSCIRCFSDEQCKTCLPGRYGVTCQDECSVGCKNNSCLIDTGKCECSDNFIGNTCTDCIHGRYGRHCNISCPIYCKNDKCETFSGVCIEGCKLETITGDNCNACVSGAHGEFCNESCPPNCLANTCDRYSSVCTRGCRENFYGTFCNMCITGKYGTNCEQNCPEKCSGSVCDQDSGICFSCFGNYSGDSCKTCQPRFFGLTCNEKCSLHCRDDTCDVETGLCNKGCKNDYSGDRCCINNGNCVKCSTNTDCVECEIGYYGLSCKQKCAKKCAGACQIVNGKCEACADDMYGSFCELKCPKNCKALPEVHVSRCEQLDGKCHFGCEDGYFGITCNESCGSICIDNECNQKSGKCTKGCQGEYDENICFRSQVKGNQPTTVIVLGTILGVVGVAATAIGVFVVLKRRSSQRRHLNGNTVVQYENKVAIDESMQGPNIVSDENESPYDTMEPEQVTVVLSETQTDNYEKINNVRGSEHYYEERSFPVSD